MVSLAGRLDDLKSMRFDEEGDRFRVRQPALQTAWLGVFTVVGMISAWAAVRDGQLDGIVFVALWLVGVLTALFLSTRPAIRGDDEGLELGAVRRDRMAWDDLLAIELPVTRRFFRSSGSLVLVRRSGAASSAAIGGGFVQGTEQFRWLAGLTADQAERRGGARPEVREGGPARSQPRSGLGHG